MRYGRMQKLPANPETPQTGLTLYVNVNGIIGIDDTGNEIDLTGQNSVPGSGNVLLNTGSADALVITDESIVGAPAIGTVLNVFLKETNTDAMTLTLNDVEYEVFKLGDQDADMTAGSIAPMQVNQFVYDGSFFQFFGVLAGGMTYNRSIITFDMLSAAATAEQIGYLKLPFSYDVERMLVKQITPFAGAGITGVDAGFEEAESGIVLMDSFDAAAAAGATVGRTANAPAGNDVFPRSGDSIADLQVTITTSGGNVNALTAGEFEIITLARKLAYDY